MIIKKQHKRVTIRKNDPKRFILLGLFLMCAIFLLGMLFFTGKDVAYQSVLMQPQVALQQPLIPESPFKKHKPESVRALYATMNTVSNQKRLDTLIDTARRAKANALVVDVKGSGGELIFDVLDAPSNTTLTGSAKTAGVKDDILGAQKLTRELHDKGVYVIARIVVFQDSGMAKTNPEAMIKNKNGGIWRDRKGFAWLDPAGTEGWQHVFGVAKRAIDAGFDEINYDYVRFPSDGDIEQATYPFWNEKIPRYEVMRSFFAESRRVLKEYDPDIALSIDIFGYTFLKNDDLGIGQRVGDALEYFDGVYPMVYPSHYSTGNFGFANPAEYPYEVVKGTLEKGLASLGDKAESAKPKIRPWLQAFNLGAVYTPAFIRAQTQATADALAPSSAGSALLSGTSWLMWDPRNEYASVRNYLESAAKRE